MASRCAPVVPTMNAHGKILRGHALFEGLSTRTLNHLTENSTIIEYPKGSIVYEEGDEGNALYLILSGRCQSVMMLPGNTETVLDIYAPGDTFGERALLGHDEQWTTVRVITDSVVLRLDGGDVHRMIEKTPRLAGQLVSRLRDHMRSLSERVDRLQANLGRVAALTSLSHDLAGSVLAESLAISLRKETGQPVLYVKIIHVAGKPCLKDWSEGHPDINGGFRFAQDIRDIPGDTQLLRLCSEGTDSECEGIASLIGHLARHFQYVVVAVGVEVAPQIVLEFQQQSDLSYVFFGQGSEDLYRANLLVRQIRRDRKDSIQHVRPVVCLKEKERCKPYKELDDVLGVPVHGSIHGLPKPGPDDEIHYLRCPRDRFSSQLRRLAREIGRCRVGLALSSGGAKGLAHVGVLQVLEEHGIDIDVIAGVSMGAYIGALKAFGLTGEEMGQLALEMEGRFGLLKILDPMIPPRKGFIKGVKSRRLLEQTIGDAHFSDMTLQLRIAVTDLASLERVVYDSGQISPVVQASMAMPGIVLPVELDDRTYVDGGVADPLPVDILMEMGVERIIAVNTIPNPQEMKTQVQMVREVAAAPREHHNLFPSFKHYLNYFEEGNVLDIWMRSMHGMQTRVAEVSCQQADVVLRPVSPGSKWHDFANASRYVQLGRDAAEAQIDEIKELVGIGVD